MLQYLISQFVNLLHILIEFEIEIQSNSHNKDRTKIYIPEEMDGTEDPEVLLRHL